VLKDENMPPKNFTIGVIILCFNQEDSIKAAIQSAVNQDLPFDQIVLADDESSDNSLKIINSFSNIDYSYSKINYVSGSNVGTYENFKRGLNLISCDYVIKLDGDDILLPSAVDTIKKIVSFNFQQRVYLTRLYKNIKFNYQNILSKKIFIWITGFNFIDKFTIRFANLAPGPGAIYPTEKLKIILNDNTYINMLMDDWLIYYLCLKNKLILTPVNKTYYVYNQNLSKIGQSSDTKFEINYLKPLKDFNNKDFYKSAHKYKILKIFEHALYSLVLFLIRTHIFLIFWKFFFILAEWSQVQKLKR
jgi:glycosyltransferase involved in cell wall biosynthesis